MNAGPVLGQIWRFSLYYDASEVNVSAPRQDENEGSRKEAERVRIKMLVKTFPFLKKKAVMKRALQPPPPRGAAVAGTRNVK